MNTLPYNPYLFAGLTAALAATPILQATALVTIPPWVLLAVGLFNAVAGVLLKMMSPQPPLKQFVLLHEQCMRPAGLTATAPFVGATLADPEAPETCESCDALIGRAVCRRRIWIVETVKRAA